MASGKQQVNDQNKAEYEFRKWAEEHEISSKTRDKLRKEGYINLDAIERLTEGQMKDMGISPGQVVAIQDWQQTRKSCDTLDVPAVKILTNCALCVGEWRNLARSLGLSEGHIQEILETCLGPTKCLETAIRNAEAGEKSPRDVLKALRDNGHLRAAGKLEQHLLNS